MSSSAMMHDDTSSTSEISSEDGLLKMARGNTRANSRGDHGTTATSHQQRQQSKTKISINPSRRGRGRSNNDGRPRTTQQRTATKRELQRHQSDPNNAAVAALVVQSLGDNNNGERDDGAIKKKHSQPPALPERYGGRLASAQLLPPGEERHGANTSAKKGASHPSTGASSTRRLRTKQKEQQVVDASSVQALTPEESSTDDTSPYPTTVTSQPQLSPQNYVRRTARPGAFAVLPWNNVSAPSSPASDSVTSWTDRATMGDNGRTGVRRARNNNDDAFSQAVQDLAISAHLVVENEPQPERSDVHSRGGIVLTTAVNHVAQSVSQTRSDRSHEATARAKVDGGLELATAVAADDELPRLAAHRKRLRRIVAAFSCALVVLLAVVGSLVGAFVRTRQVGGSSGGSAGTSNSVQPNNPSHTSEPQPFPGNGNGNGSEPQGCVPGLFYFTYDSSFRNGVRAIGALNVSADDNAGTTQFLSSPDCMLHSLAIDHRTRTVYGICLSPPSLYIVTVNLQTGETTWVANLPSTEFRGLAYNPADDRLYTGARPYSYGDYPSATLVRIEKNWTLTNAGSPMGQSLSGGMAFGPDGSAIATVDFGAIYALNWTAGTSSRLRTNFPNAAAQNIAFDSGSALYGIAHGPTTPLYKFDVVGDTVTQTFLKSSGADNPGDGAFCPL